METDFTQSAACFQPRWPPESCPVLTSPPSTSVAKLRRTTLILELLDRRDDVKHEPVILGAALLPLKDACDARGAPAPFLVVFSQKGSSVGELSGALRANGLEEEGNDCGVHIDEDDDDDDDDDDEHENEEGRKINAALAPPRVQYPAPPIYEPPPSPATPGPPPMPPPPPPP